MPADDRNQKFERALAQHLRGNPAGAGCPDAETLGAYHERTLSVEELAQWKQHIAGCAACQETLALVEETEKQLSEEWQDQLVGSMRSLAAVPRGEERELVARAMVAAATPGETPKRRMRPKMARWAIPLGAMAASVLIAIGIYEQHALRSPESNTVEMAQNERQAAPELSAPAGTTKESKPPEQDLRRAERDQLAVRPGATAVGQVHSAPNALPSPAAADSLRKDEEIEKKQTLSARVSSINGNAPAVPPPSPAGVAKEETPRSTTQSVEVLSETKPASTSAPPPSAPKSSEAGYAGAVAGTLDDGKRPADASKAKTSQQSLSRNMATNEMMAKQGGIGALVQIAAASGGTILTPDHKVWWKLGADGTAELTTDGGEKWKTIPTGAAAMLTSGSAPSAKICWIAGKAGTLVVTTDRGGHWTIVPTPIAGDLGGVHAVDGKHASIWDAAKRQSYETSDGGNTWKQITNE